ncbi:WhiB family transcriptional regulator [Actinocrinis sp.]|uniref:WhiB family transcriptional regulator n=1 Tax=Actinocrinis sp. TaxID=1920516 RepID=UPI002D64BBB6|nr:WhiB family transcriptional regulator [Actinocrinis sp.]HZP54977.1 WhiB family transcriptional regulator [Actinocrinis sp.]
MAAHTPTAVGIPAMQPFTVLSRHQREARARTATEPRDRHAGTSWMLDGACNDENPALFQPIGESALYSDQIEEARTVCSECCVMPLCREYALETRQPSGIWGGLTERDREQELRRRSRQRQQQASKRAAA